MPRPMWSGTISFGLVSIPVKLYNAVSRKGVSFNQLDSRSNSRIKLKKTSAADGSDVPDDAIVKGYEISKDTYVVLTQEEIDSVDPQSSRAIDIEEFIDLSEIDPIFFDSPYYLVPDKGTAKPYKLLTEAMDRSSKVAIARFVMRNKQYLAAVRAVDGHLVLSTMVYADEVVDPVELPELRDAADVEVTDRELTMAMQLVESLAAPFEPAKFHDTHRQRLLDMIDQKAAGVEVAAPQPVTANPQVVDLLAALEASVAEAKAARGRHPSAHEPAEAVVEDDKPVRQRRKKSA
jgi:DNA end-binding protein Ku